MTTLEPPALLIQGASERAIEFEEQETDLERQIRDYYRELLMEYRGMLDRTFLQNFYANLNAAKESMWDPTTALQLGLIDQLTDSFNDLIDSAAEPMDELLDDELVEGYEQSHDRTLWLLYLGGIDTRDADAPPGFSAIKAALIGAGVAGVGYSQRLGIWNSEVKSRFSQQLRASIVGGRTGRDTLDTYDALTTSYVGRVEGLGKNELHRAYTVGAAAATEPYQGELFGEVWLTKRDPAVCSICAAKELTITDDQPITHSHPGCRCWKVPIPIDYRQQPIDYVAFLEQLGRR